MECPRSGRKLALKRIVCHSKEDQAVAQREAELHARLRHPNIIECVGSQVEGEADITRNKTSQVLILLPFFPVNILIIVIGFS